MRVGRLLATATLLGLSSCGGSDTTGPGGSGSNVLTISRTSVALTSLGESIRLTATLRDASGVPLSAVITWASDDASVVTVDANGNVVAIANGNTTLRATSGSLSATASASVQQVATTLTIVSGDAQSTTVGEQLADPIVVSAQDQGGSGVAGVGVSFTTDASAGSLSAESATTDADGEASTAWTLGTVSGALSLVAAVTSGGAGELTLAATALAGAAVAFVKSSGDQQTGTNGNLLPEPVVVALKDQFGNGVPGGEVNFVVVTGGGSVSPAQVTSTDDGTAQTAWTMGAAVGANSLTASADGFTDLAFAATAELHVPRADLAPSNLSISPTNATNQQALTVTVTITNSGDLTTGTTFDVQLLIDGTESATQTVGPLAAGASTEATFNVAPLSSGVHTLSIVADPANGITESDESNNAAEQNAPVAGATLLTAGSPISNLSSGVNSELLFNFELPASDNLRIEVSGGTADDVDLYVHRGTRPGNRDDYQCQSGSPISRESCTFNGAEAGTYHIILFAFTAFSGVSLTAVVGEDVVPFNIDLVFVSSGSAEQDAAFRTAAATFERIIKDDIHAHDFSANPLPENTCVDGQQFVSGEIDDIQIYVNIRDLDGPGGTLAQAGPCRLRGLSELPINGVMTFDIADLNNLQDSGLMLPVIKHEMAHVLGLGTLWDRKDLLVNPSLPSNQGADTHFIGPLAIAAFDAAGGTSYTGGGKVPVENIKGQGSGDAHWRESVLGTESMTPTVNSNVHNPFSAISIQSLADIGYRVDVTQAEPYFLLLAAQLRIPDESAVDLSGDIRQGPIIVMNPKGRRR